MVKVTFSNFLKVRNADKEQKVECVSQVEIVICFLVTRQEQRDK